MGAEFSGGVDHIAGDQFNSAGIGKGAAYDEHQRDDHGCRMAEAGKSIRFWHHAQNERRSERPESYQVIAPTPPDQENEDNE